MHSQIIVCKVTYTEYAYDKYLICTNKKFVQRNKQYARQNAQKPSQKD